MTTVNLYLKSLDVNETIEKYNKGFFFNIKIPSQKLTIKQSEMPSFSNGMSMFRDKNSGLVQIHSTNITVPTRCFWCMNDLPKDTSLHVPIPNEMFSMTRLNEKNEIVKDYYFETTMGGDKGGGACSFECGLSFIKNFNFKEKDNLEIYLKTLYRLCYPDKPPLKQAPDFRLHVLNGGTLPDDEFKTTKSVYVRIPSVKLINSSEQFILY